MKPKGLLIAVVLLAALGGVIFWSNKKQAAAGKSPADTTTKILTIPEDQIQEIRMKKLTGETLALRRDAANKWQITAPQPMGADQDAVSSIALQVASLNADKMVEDHATDLKPYGLQDPTLDVTVVRKDGKTDDLLVGDDTPNGSGAYAKLANDPRVFTIGTYVKTTLDKRPDDLRDKRLLTFDADKLTRVEVQAKGAPIEFGKNGSNEWQIVKPHPMRADSTSVDTLVNKLKDAKLDVSMTTADAAKKFAGAPKVATVTVTDAGGTQTLELHKDKDNDVLAKSSVVDGVYKTGSDIAEAFDKSVDDFRNKKVFDFGFSDPNQLIVQGVTYAKVGDKWMSNNKAMDNIAVQNLIDKLRDMKAIAFSDKGSGEQAMQITVISNAGKRTEKVTLLKGAKLYAQREGEPVYYELNLDDLFGIQKAVGDIKEAAPIPAKK